MSATPPVPASLLTAMVEHLHYFNEDPEEIPEVTPDPYAGELLVIDVDALPHFRVFADGVEISFKEVEGGWAANTDGHVGVLIVLRGVNICEAWVDVKNVTIYRFDERVVALRDLLIVEEDVA